METGQRERNHREVFAMQLEWMRIALQFITRGHGPVGSDMERGPLNEAETKGPGPQLEIANPLREIA